MSKFMCICDLHHSIIQEYKLCPSCTLNSAVCFKGCPNAEKPHKFINHEGIKARQFYSIFNQTRENYFSILQTFESEILPQFMARIRLQINQLQKQIRQQWQANSLLIVQKLCRIGQKTTKDVMEIVSELKVEDIELSKLMCKETYIIKYFLDQKRQVAEGNFRKVFRRHEAKLSDQSLYGICSKLIHKDAQKQGIRFLRIKIVNFCCNLKKVRIRKIIVRFEPQSKSQIPILVEVEDLRELPRKMIDFLEDQCQMTKQGKLNNKITEYETINLKVRLNMVEQTDKCDSNGLGKSFRQEIQKSLKCLEQFMIKCNPSKVILSIDHSLESNYITTLYGKLFSKIKLKELVIYTTQEDQETQSYLQRQIRLYSEEVKLKCLKGVDWKGDAQHQEGDSQQNSKRQNQSQEQSKVNEQKVRFNQSYAQFVKLMK